MSKELEALEKLGHYDLYESYNELQVNEIDEFDIVKQALQRLEQINNANPSEALKCLEENLKCYSKPICNGSMVKNEYVIDYWHYCINNEKIKDTLLKAQELKSDNNALLEENNDLYAELTFANKQYKELTEYTKQYEKALKIIFEKKVDIELLEFCEDRYEYNMHFSFIEVYHLTEEEFNLLKRWAENEKIN